MIDRIDCEYYLVRYVPDLIREEFVNIGVVVKALPSNHESDEPPSDSAGFRVSITDNWTRVLAVHPDADTDFLSRLGTELQETLSGHTGRTSSENVMQHLLDDCANCVQVSGPKYSSTLAPASELARLMNLYVEPRSNMEDSCHVDA